MTRTDITVIVELELRKPGLVFDRRIIAQALRRTGIDCYANIVDVRLVLGTVEQLVTVQRDRPYLVHGSATKKDDLVLRVAEGR